MKRLIAALSLAALAAPAFAQPYEQTQFDRGIYNVEQNASAGSTVSRADNSVWSSDYNFVAPAK